MVFENDRITVDGTTYTFTGEFKVDKSSGSVRFAVTTPTKDNRMLVYREIIGNMGPGQLESALEESNVQESGNSHHEVIVRDPVLNARSVLEVDSVEE